MANEIKLNKHYIESVAQTLMCHLKEYGLATDVCIYYNGKRLSYSRDEFVYEDDMDPRDYFEYVAEKHIMSMSFEGPLYDYMDNYCQFPDAIEKLLESWGLWYELGNMWNLTFYVDDYEGVEYLDYSVKEEESKLAVAFTASQTYGVPDELVTIARFWYYCCRHEGDKGTCVLGAGINFDYNGVRYLMGAHPGFQGEGSWNPSRPVIESMLKEIGATNITHVYGHMD